MTGFARRDFLLAGVGLSAVCAAAGGGEGASEPEPVRFEAVAGFELAEVLKSHPLALIPLGSLEYHGPHNPLGSDSIIVSGVAEHVAARTQALLFPTVTFTHCPAHTAHFPGTLSMRPEVMTMYFEDILRAVRNAGFNRIFVLNGHDGNVDRRAERSRKLRMKLPQQPSCLPVGGKLHPKEICDKLRCSASRMADMVTADHSRLRPWPRSVLSGCTWTRPRTCRHRQTSRRQSLTTSKSHRLRTGQDIRVT